ncbi:hypothetical protein BC827DRAFT_1195151 [Russula dissimulans]|nr:hypothetical protein BC827DRAFT_1195151 [Russula dissimulans]
MRVVFDIPRNQIPTCGLIAGLLLVISLWYSNKHTVYKLRSYDTVNIESFSSNNFWALSSILVLSQIFSVDGLLSSLFKLAYNVS